MLNIYTNGLYFYELQESDYNVSGFMKFNKRSILINSQNIPLASNGYYIIKLCHSRDYKTEEITMHAFFSIKYESPFDLSKSYLGETEITEEKFYFNPIVIIDDNNFEFELIYNNNYLQFRCEIIKDILRYNQMSPHYLKVTITNEPQKVKGVLPFRFLRQLSNDDIITPTYKSI